MVENGSNSFTELQLSSSVYCVDVHVNDYPGCMTTQQMGWFGNEADSIILNKLLYVLNSVDVNGYPGVCDHAAELR